MCIRTAKAAHSETTAAAPSPTSLRDRRRDVMQGTLPHASKLLLFSLFSRSGGGRWERGAGVMGGPEPSPSRGWGILWPPPMKVTDHLANAKEPLISFEIIPPMRGGDVKGLLAL